MIHVEERDDVSPICPYCEKKLHTVYTKRIESFFGKRYMFFCPHCNKVLGVTHRKGNLMN